jgi:uncharacterized membrane protein
VNIPAWLSALPVTTNGVWGWFLVISLVYMLARKCVARLRESPSPALMECVLDAATFAGSSLLLVGILNPPTLQALGDTTAFLVVGGLGGFVYTGDRLLSEGLRPRRNSRW